MKNKKSLISIIITNYNKGKFLKKSLESALSQNYTNFEIILFDDCSTDDSLEIINKFKKIKLIKNKKKKFSSGPLNQINGILKAYKKSKGDLICLLDSDDKFTKLKLSKIHKFFTKNPNKKFVVNLTKNNLNFSLKRKSSDVSGWPTIFPTSCISFRRSFFLEFVKNIKLNSFSNLEIDARLVIHAYHYSKDFNIISNKLTDYVKTEDSISSNYPKFSRKWWSKRKEAFEYLQFILKRKKIMFIKSFDYNLTNIMYFFLYLLKKD